MTVLPLATDRVAVNVNVAVPELPSVRETSLIEMDGGESSFTMVPSPCVSAIVAFVATDRLTKYVSFVSSLGSPATGTEIVFMT